MSINYPAAFLLTLLTPSLIYADAPPTDECVPASCSVPSAQIGNDQVDLICVRYDFPQPGQSAWFYTVQSGDRPAISHVVFSLNLSCLEVVESGTWAASPDDRQPGEGMPEIRVSPDPTTGVSGLKFDLGFEDGESRNYYFVLNNNFESSNAFSIAIKGGNGFDIGSLCGPSEDCTILSECAGACDSPAELTAVPVYTQAAFRDADPRNFLAAAEVSWQTNSCATSYRVCAQNQITGERVCVPTTASSVTFDQLVRGTSYLFAAKARCADGARSPWSDVIAYTTPAVRQSGQALPTWDHFPNPAMNTLTVRWDAGFESIEIQLKDIAGSEHARETLYPQAEAGEHTLTLDGLVEGLYLLTVWHDGKPESRPVVVQR